MPTELDKDIHRFTAAVTAPGQMFETTPVERRGVEMPAFKNAPPSLAHYFAHFCNEKKDELFLVDGDLRGGEVDPRGGRTGSSPRVGDGLGHDVGLAFRRRVGAGALQADAWPS